MLTPKINSKELQKMLSVVASPAQAASVVAVLSRDPGRTQLIASLQIWQGKLLTKMEGLKQIGWAYDPNAKSKTVSFLVERATGYHVDGIDGVRIERKTPANFPTVTFPMMAFLADLVRHEGLHEFMYLDSRGNVTIGIGHLISDAGAAVTLHGSVLPFHHRASSTPATDVEVIADFNKVRTAPAGQKARFYRAYTKLDVSRSAARALAQTDVTTRLSGLTGSGRHPGFDRYPAPAQQAIMDMVFNLGQTGFQRFNKFELAAQFRDWKTAAAESSRTGVQPSRNTGTANLLQAAAAEDLKNNHFFINTNPKIANFRKIVTLSTTNVATLKITKQP